MKIGTQVDDLGDLAAELIRAFLTKKALDSCLLHPTAIDAVVAARVVTEPPDFESEEGGRESLGRLIAARVLNGRTLFIDAGDDGITLRLDDEIVREEHLRQLLDFDTFAALHAEWRKETGSSGSHFDVRGSGRVVLTGADSNWMRYYREPTD